MTKLLFFVFLNIFLIFNMVFASPKVSDESLKEMLSNTFKNIKIDSVSFNQDLDMYEVVIEGNVFYITSNMKYAIMGTIFDVSNTSKPVNITAQKQMEINKHQLSLLNKEYALKIGSGPIEIVEISSPRCEHCKKLAQYMKDKENQVTRYIFLVGVDNDPLVNYILCQPNNDSRVRSYRDVYLNNKNIATTKSCDYVLSHTETVKKINILGVPVLYVRGNMIKGANIELIDNMIKVELNKVNKDKEVQKQ